MVLYAFAQGLKARGNVEDWLGKVEESMVASLRKLAKGSIADYESRPREEWVTLHPSQVPSSRTSIAANVVILHFASLSFSKLVFSPLEEMHVEMLMVLNDSHLWISTSCR